jgi:ribonuclease HI
MARNEMSGNESSAPPTLVYVAGGGVSRETQSAYAFLIVGSGALIRLNSDANGNEGVYLALITAIRILPRGAKVQILMDAELVVRQCVGAAEARHPDIRLLRRRFWILAIQRDFEMEFRLIPRAENKAINLLRMASDL